MIGNGRLECKLIVNWPYRKYNKNPILLIKSFPMPKLKKTLNINIISLKTGLDQIYAMFKNLKAYFLNFFVILIN